MTFRNHWVVRYAGALAAVGAALLLRVALTAWVGPGLPTYITFYPVVMAVALLGGFGPGLVATALAGVVVAYWIIPPVGEFSIASPVDRLGLVLFAGMGLFMSAVAEFYRRHRRKAAAYDREAALRESQARLATFAAATFEGIVESEAGRILDCNEQFACMLGYTTAELKGMEIAHLVVPEDRDRVIGNIRQGRELVIEHVALRKDGTRIVVEAHGQPVSPGSARRLTAVRDITERKQAETALQTTLQRFYDVLSSMSSGVLLVTDEGRVEFANQAVCDRFGLADAPADLVGLAARDMIEKIKHAYLHPDKAAARIREIVERGQPVRGEEIAMQGGGACLRDFVPLNVQGKSCGRLWLHFDITERNRVEEALRQSEERLRLLGDNLPDSAVYQYVHETDGRVQFLYFSEGIERLNGVSVPAVLRDAGELHRQIPPEWFARLVAAEAQSARDLSDFDMEVPMRRPDGQVRWMRLQSRPRRMPDGRTVWDGVQTDITARKEVEAALRESRERLDLALLSSRMATFDWDIVKNKRTWSNGVHSLLGTRPETFTGTAEEFFQVIHPADRSTVQAALARAVECTGEYETEYRAIWPDGGTHHLSARGKVHRDSAGRAVQMTGVCWDITERKQAEEALHESEARYRNLFNAIDAGFCIVEMIFDAQGKPADYRFLEVNAAFKKQTGLQAAEGKLMRELAPAHEAQWFAIYGKIALTGEPARFVNEAKALNRWYDVYAYRVGAPESRQVAILFNDISAHKLAEAELRRQAEELRAANEELVRFNRVTVGRELRIIELKKQVNELCTRLGQPPRYASELGQEPPPTP